MGVRSCRRRRRLPCPAHGMPLQGHAPMFRPTQHGARPLSDVGHGQDVRAPLGTGPDGIRRT